MAAHKDNLGIAFVLLLQPIDVWQSVQTVDTTVCPEVNNHNFATQLARELELERVEPLMVRRKLLDLVLQINEAYKMLVLTGHGVKTNEMRSTN